MNKKLAKWYGLAALNLLRNNAWSPDLNNNQLDMLKKKFIKEAEITRIEYDKLNTGWWEGTYYISNTDDFYNAEGKDINEADLNTIIEYAEKKIE